ncbi:MAG: 30S ribosomal protein S17 [Thermodesulfobacteriota bacterium]
MAEGQSSRRKRVTGSVLGAKMDKTIVVGVEGMKKHPLYGKYLKRLVKYKAHDEKNVCTVGDKVLIVETRPLSKTKRWRVLEILEKAK